MFGIHNYLSFIGAIAVFQLAPGPGTLTILNATARHGMRSGMAAVLGTLTGDLLFMLAAVLGLAALLAAQPAILSALQWAGIAYLCWLGFTLLRSSESRNEAEKVQADNHWACFGQAFAVCITNPKAIMFFMAFFPLFLAVDSHPRTLSVMIAHVSLISLVYQTGLVVVGNVVARKLARFQSAGTLARRTVGLGMIAFGIKLAINR